MARPLLPPAAALLLAACSGGDPEQPARENLVEEAPAAPGTGAPPAAWQEDSRALATRLEQDEAGTLAALAALDGSHDYGKVGRALARYYFEHDIHAGLEAFGTLDANPSLSVPLLARFVEKYGKSDPAGARRWIAENAALRGAPNAAAALGLQDGKLPEPATLFDAFASGDAPSPVKSNYLRGLAESWLEEDFNAVFAHLESVDPSPELDRTFALLVEKGVRADPSAIMGWALSITGEGLRRSSILLAAEQWQITDLEGYQDWKTSADLPGDFRQELP